MFKNIHHYFNKLKFILPTALKKKLITLYFLLLVAAVFEMISLGSIPVFVSFLIDNQSELLILNYDIKSSLVNFFPGVNLIKIFPLVVIFLFLFKNLFLLFVLYLEQKIIRDVKIFFVNNIFEAYIKKPYAFFLDKNSSELTRNIINESQTATSLIANILQFSREFSVLIVIFLLLVFFEPFITLFSISTLLIFGLFFYKIFNKFLKVQGEIRLKFLSKVFDGINTMIGAIKDIKIYFKENFFLEKFKKNSNLYENVMFKVSVVQRSPRIFFEFISVMVLFVVFYIFIGLDKDILSILPILGLLVISIVRLMPAFSTMSSNIYYIKYVKESFDRVSDEIISFTKNITDNLKNKKLNESQENLLKISNLEFFYQSNKNIVPLSNINLDISKGDMVGIIGQSGAGKSTLINLILGLLSPTSGNITYDRKKSIKKNFFSYVPQDIYLLDGSLKENIIFGEDDRSDNNYLNGIVEAAGLSNLIEKNKKGLDLIVGERGIRLSGGEKQRVGIARALYKDPEILILDEATSSLDNKTESAIMGSINSLKKKLTIIIVSHRLSTIKNCDNIFFIKDGKIFDKGNLNYLLKKYPEDLFEKN